MTGQELNERLAKWRGFKENLWSEHGGWVPNEKGYEGCESIDFPTDLNAIFKWLVPEIKGIPVITLDLDPECDGTRAYGCLLQIKDCYDVVVHRYVAWSNEPARALAEAIGQMIDNE